MMINGISEKERNDMSMEEVELFSTFESLYREANNKQIAHWIAKSMMGGK